MMLRILPLLLTAVFAASGQKYNGPVPPKSDLPYLKHAENLIPTEAAVAKEDKKKDEITYTIEGANSPVRTPLASPIFLIQADKLLPDRLGLYKLEIKSGHREAVATPKRPLKGIRTVVSKLNGNLYRIEVDESLEPGEYALTPEGTSNQVFCFQVY
ncbi:MAG TPA: hypothetical protein VKU19_41830 [Bryobacteraceae bacterium]|nr:hypothetical protein [Bryobacteraceae bacterium]